MKTTLTEILKHNPSEQVKQKFLNTTDSIDFMTIYEIIGIKDAIWCLRTQDYKDYCLFLADVAESVLPIFEAEYPDDKRPRQAIKAIRDWHNGIIDRKQLYILSDAAYAAVSNSYKAAYDVVYGASACAAGGIVYAGTYAVHAAINAGAGWEKIEELFIKHFGDKQ